MPWQGQVRTERGGEGGGGGEKERGGGGIGSYCHHFLTTVPPPPPPPLLLLSGILPNLFSRIHKDTTYYAIAITTLVQVFLVTQAILGPESGNDILNNASILCGLFHYLSIFACFIKMKYR